MVSLFRTVLFLSLLITTQFTQAQTSTYQVNFPAWNYQPLYQNLDLNGPTQITITTTLNSNPYTNPYPFPTISSVEMKFPYAKTFTATNFSFDGFVSRAVVEGAWVFNKVLVEIEGSPEIQPGNSIQVRLYVMEGESFTNPMFGQNIFMYEANGPVEDITKNKLADTETVTFDGKALTLDLQQSPRASCCMGEGFVVNALWLGHGEGTFYMPTPFPATEYARAKAVALNLQPEPMPDGNTEYSISINYQMDEYAPIETTPFEPLRMYLDQAIPPLPYPYP